MFEHTSALVDDKFGVDDYPSIIGPLPPGKVEYDNQGYDSNYSTGGSLNSRILDGLGEGVEPRESRFRRHIDGIDGLRSSKKFGFCAV